MIEAWAADKGLDHGQFDDPPMDYDDFACNTLGRFSFMSVENIEPILEVAYGIYLDEYTAASIPRRM